MCGIAGILAASSAVPDELSSALEVMTHALAHRGPDAQGEWLDAEAGIALGHRRLSIIDLSERGAQPMISPSGRYVISYNGEVYNFEELRHEIAAASGTRFHGTSDTEVILAAVDAYGLTEAVQRLVGMFAFALWDREARKLFLVRDRLGIKPLYWSEAAGGFLFASELKALKAHPLFRAEINHDALAGFLRYGYVAGPASIYRGVAKLQPGEILEIGAGKEPKLTRYWNLDEVVADASNRPFPGDMAEAETALEALLKDAVKRRMVADVPLGSFLSGGIDSSLVTALMQSQSSRPVKTFSIGFSESDYNEAGHAAAVAKHLGTEHTELYVSPEEALGVVPKLADIYDEPFADASQIPTYLVSSLARQHVTVALSGDGGDEVFGGYTRHVAAARFGRLLFGQPPGLRDVEAAMLKAMPSSFWDFAAGMMPERVRPRQLGFKMQKLSRVLAGGPEEFYQAVTRHWEEPSTMVIGARGTPLPYDPKQAEALLPDAAARIQYLDTITYLREDTLTKLDRASMAVGLEARVPLIDHRVVALAWSLPQQMKIRGGRGKWILRRVLEKHLPHELIERPKSGFTVPIGAWLRGPLRDWAEALLDENRLRSQGYFKPEPIRRKWNEHLSGRRDWQQALWDVLMFQAWVERWK